MEEKNKGTKRPKRNGTRPAKNSGKRIGKSRPEKADNARRVTLFPYTTLFRSIGRASCREKD